MTDVIPELEQEINDLSKKCQEDIVYRQSAPNKEKVTEISKKIDTQIANESKICHIYITKFYKALRSKKLSYIY